MYDTKNFLKSKQDLEVVNIKTNVRWLQEFGFQLNILFNYGRLNKSMENIFDVHLWNKSV